MDKYNNVGEYLKDNDLTREDLKDLIARSALFLCTDCARNFGDSPEITEKVVEPIYFLNEIIDKVD